MSISPPRRANSRPCSRRPTAVAVAPRAISEILEPYTAPRAAIEPDLPPDHPLEPGTRPTARAATPSERIAASESAISEIPAESREPVSTSSFIAAARRAAQAAAAAPPADKAGRSPFKGPLGGKAKDSKQGFEQGREYGPEQGAVDHHLQDPLAAGRRERGRDRARHLQDGDDAARPGNRAADAGDGEFDRAGACGPAARRTTAPGRRRPRPHCPR